MNLFIMQVLSNITLTCNMEHNVVGVLIKHFIKKKKLLCVCSSDLQILIMTISLEREKKKVFQKRATLH